MVVIAGTNLKIPMAAMTSVTVTLFAARVSQSHWHRFSLWPAETKLWGSKVQLVLRCAALRFVSPPTPTRLLKTAPLVISLYPLDFYRISSLSLRRSYNHCPSRSPCPLAVGRHFRQPSSPPRPITLWPTFLPPSPRAIVISYEFMSFDSILRYHHTCPIQSFRGLYQRTSTCEALHTRAHSVAVTKRKRRISEWQCRCD